VVVIWKWGSYDCKFGKKTNIMAKVKSLFAISGTISDLTFRQTRSGPVAQRRPGPTREHILTHKNCQITRLNAAVFKRVTQDGKLLREALFNAIDSVRHPLLNSMMIKVLHATAKTDKQSKAHCRHAAAGDISLLEGFEFNDQLSLAQALPVKFAHSMDVKTGNMQLEIPAFIARRKKGFPKEATHFRIMSCGVAIDFADKDFNRHASASELLPIGKQTPGPICIEHQLTAKAGEVMFHVMGVEFYKVENGKSILLKWGAMRIVAVARKEEELYESGKPELLHTAAMPYMAKELQAITNQDFKRLSARNYETLLIDSCFACCYDSMMGKLPDIV
jgi:hypothetical protein